MAALGTERGDAAGAAGRRGGGKRGSAARWKEKREAGVGGWGGAKVKGGGRASRWPRTKRRDSNSISYKVRSGNSRYSFLEKRPEKQNGLGELLLSGNFSYVK